MNSWTKVTLISDEASDSELDAWYENFEYEGFIEQPFYLWLKQNTTGEYFMYEDNVRFANPVDATMFALWYAGQ